MYGVPSMYVGYQALPCALLRGHADRSADWLPAEYVMPDSRLQALHFAAEMGQVEACRLLCQSGCGTRDIILDRLSLSQPHAASHTPGDMLYFVPSLLHVDWCLQSDDVSHSGPTRRPRRSRAGYSFVLDSGLI